MLDCWWKYDHYLLGLWKPHRTLSPTKILPKYQFVNQELSFKTPVPLSISEQFDQNVEVDGVLSVPEDREAALISKGTIYFGLIGRPQSKASASCMDWVHNKPSTSCMAWLDSLLCTQAMHGGVLGL